MSYSYVLCEEKKDKSVSPIFLVAIAREAFLQESSAEERLIAIHALAGGIHPTRSLYPNSLWTEEKVAESFPNLPIEYINSPEELLAFRERLSNEGWRWDTDAGVDLKRHLAQIKPVSPTPEDSRAESSDPYGSYDDMEDGKDEFSTLSWVALLLACLCIVSIGWIIRIAAKALKWLGSPHWRLAERSSVRRSATRLEK